MIFAMILSSSNAAPFFSEIHIFISIESINGKIYHVTIVTMCGKVHFWSYLLNHKYVERKTWLPCPESFE